MSRPDGKKPEELKPEDLSVENSGETLKRTSSAVFGQQVKSGVRKLYVVDPDGGKTLLDEDLDLFDFHPLGRGQQGRVYAVVSDDNRRCVLKQLAGKQPKGAEPFSAHRKATEKHDTSTEYNVVKLIEVIEHDGDTFALLPYCGLFLDGLQKQLPNLIRSNPQHHEAIILHVMSDLLRAIEYMHSNGFAHGDIKPENIAYYRGHWCLIDLDCAVQIGSEVGEFAGSPHYVHPACFSDRNQRAQPGNDIYALGQVLKMLLNPSISLDNVDGSLSEAAKQKTELYESEKAIYEARKKLSAQTGDGAIRSLREVFDEGVSIRDKLSIIADRMTSAVPAMQPSVAELRDCFEQLKNELLSKTKCDTLESELHGFYDALKSSGFFLDEPATPGINRCLSNLSLFSSTSRKSSSSQEQVSPDSDPDSSL